MKSKSSLLACLVMACALVSMAGCGVQDGPVRYTLSGAITMPDGKPVPAGEIQLEPDGAAGNKGPGSMVQIKNGTYSLPVDQGILGGKYIVTIIPYDGVAFGESLQGKMLTRSPFVVKVDLPAENGTHDFKITSK